MNMLTRKFLLNATPIFKFEKAEAKMAAFLCVLYVYFSHFDRAPVEAFKNCDWRPCFRSPARGIGNSFQLAITTPRINLIGYGTATAQS